ncbi:hypothetical protein BKA93DRAFT_823444 [Sparassis latifolia]
MDHWSDLNLYTVGYSDDHTPKPVYLEAKGPDRKSRHYNSPATPTAVLRSPHSLAGDTLISLGTFSRPQRDRILQLAEAVAYEPTSTVNEKPILTRAYDTRSPVMLFYDFVELSVRRPRIPAGFPLARSKYLELISVFSTRLNGGAGAVLTHASIATITRPPVDRGDLEDLTISALGRCRGRDALQFRLANVMQSL